MKTKKKASVSLVLLILSSIMGSIMGFDPYILNMPIYYGVLYGFLSSLNELPQ